MPADAVTVFAAPPSSDTEQVGDTKELHLLPASLVTAGQQFSVLIDPLSVPEGYRRPDGLVDFSMFVTDDNGQSWATFRTARAGALPSGTTARGASDQDYRYVWVDGIYTEDDLSGYTTRDGIPVLDEDEPGENRMQSAGGETDPDDEVVDVNPWEFTPIALPTPSAVDPGQDCLQETYKGDVDRSTTIGTSYPTGNTTSRMMHDSVRSNSSELGVAMGAANNSGSINWKQSGTRDVGGSWSGVWEFKGTKRSYRIYTNYHKYILGGGCNGAVHYRRPHVETGGAMVNTNGLTRPDWNEFCSPQPANFTFIRKDTSGKAYSYGAAVKFASAIGIDLSIKKNYSLSNTLEYHFSEAGHELCGKDDYPSQASKMIDRVN